MAANSEAEQPTKTKQHVRYGRIADELGNSVTDAQIHISHVNRGGTHEAKTDENGNYAIDEIDLNGQYRLNDWTIVQGFFYRWVSETP